MPDRRGRKGSTDDFFPADTLPWARETWRDRDEVAKLARGPWMLRRAADVLGMDQEEVDRLLTKSAERAAASPDEAVIWVKRSDVSMEPVLPIRRGGANG
jgi:DNA-nicking Smr family endonuclease